jgi:hypothetical protein
MALYNEIARRDILMMCFDLLKQGVLKQRDVDGKLEFNNPAPAWDVPWHFTVQKADLNCQLWSKVMFNVVFKKVPVSMQNGTVWVPSGCQNCFKIVARPKTIKQLFAIVKLQKRLDIASKCGIEHRAHVFGNYGAYWYNRGLEEGLKNYKVVRQAIDEDPLLGPDIKVILKRSCTEMEMTAGPSDKWAISKEQMEIEALVYSTFNIDNVERKQSRQAVDYVHARWIEYAYQWGDETVFEFLDPEKPIYKPLVTYHHQIEKPEKENNNE